MLYMSYHVLHYALHCFAPSFHHFTLDHTLFYRLSPTIEMEQVACPYMARHLQTRILKLSTPSPIYWPWLITVILNLYLCNQLPNPAPTPYPYSCACCVGKHTNGSQFIITLCPLPSLDGKNVVFGQVLSGTDLLHQIASLSVVGDSHSPIQTVLITDCGEYDEKMAGRTEL